MTQEEFEAEVLNTMCIICDCIPYDTPNYREVVRRRAEEIVRELNDPDSETNRIAREHDAIEHDDIMFDAGYIDF